MTTLVVPNRHSAAARGSDETIEGVGSMSGIRCCQKGGAFDSCLVAIATAAGEACSVLSVALVSGSEPVQNRLLSNRRGNVWRV